MPSLLIDTATDHPLLLLFDQKTLIENTPLSHSSKELLPSIDALLKKKNMTPKDLDFIAIGIGPGSFTGTRIGFITAKTLSYALHIPLVPFISLKAFIPEKNQPFIVLTDAKSGLYYALAGQKTDQGVIFKKEPICSSLQEQHKPLEKASIILSPAPYKGDDPSIAQKWRVTNPNIPHLLDLVTKSYENGETQSSLSLTIHYLKSPHTGGK